MAQLAHSQPQPPCSPGHCEHQAQQQAQNRNRLLNQDSQGIEGCSGSNSYEKRFFKKTCATFHGGCWGTTLSLQESSGRIAGTVASKGIKDGSKDHSLTGQMRTAGFAVFVQVLASEPGQRL